LAQVLLVNKPANTFDTGPVVLISFHTFFIFQRKQNDLVLLSAIFLHL